MGRAPCCEKVGLKKGRWTAEEDEILMNYIKANGEGSWRSLPKNAGLLRCGKSCRLRWINYLRADLKRGNISAEEEETIIKLHASLGNRWSLIAAHLPGRTDNEIKNYWNSHLSRRIHSFRRVGADGVAVIMDLGKIVGIPCKRRGGRTCRSAMKKNNSVTVAPDAKGCRHAHGGGGGSAAALPVKEDQSEDKGSDGDGGGCHPPCGAPVAGGASGEVQSSSMLTHEEPLGGELFDGDDQLLPSEFWETTKAIAGELFIPSEETGAESRGTAVEHSGGGGSTEEGDSGGWCAVSSLSEERKSGGATMSSSSVSEERDRAGTTGVSGEGRDRLGEAGDVAVAVSSRKHHPQAAETEECNSAATMDRWAGIELEEMAARLWEEAGDAWPWQSWAEDAACSTGEMHLQQQAMGGGYEEGDTHSWLLSDYL